jgi:hypothetical protein
VRGDAGLKKSMDEWLDGVFQQRFGIECLSMVVLLAMALVYTKKERDLLSKEHIYLSLTHTEQSGRVTDSS